MPSVSYNMQKMCLRPGLCPGPHWGAHDAPRLPVGWGGDTDAIPHPTRRLRRLDPRASGAPCPLHIIARYATTRSYVVNKHIEICYASHDRVTMVAYGDQVSQFKVQGFTRERDNYTGAPLSKAIFDQYAAMTRKQCEIRHKLVVFTNRKSRTDFVSVPISVTLGDFERPLAVIMCYFTKHGSFWSQLRQIH